LSALDSVSPTDAELTLRIFKTLRGNQSTSPRSFMESEYERYGREWKQAHDQTKVERAFHYLHLLGYARESGGYYTLIDTKSTANVLMRALLKNPYNETKTNLNEFYRGRLIARALLWLSLGMAVSVILVASSLAVLSSFTTIEYARFFGICFGILFLCSAWMANRNARFWDRHGLSNEKSVAVRLVDAYDLYVNPKIDETSNAVTIVGKASRILQVADQTTSWNTITQDRNTLSKIGEDLRAKVLPAMIDKKGDKVKIGGVLVRLACLFFDSTSESICHASELLEPLPTGPSVHAPTITSMSRTMVLELTETRIGQLSLSAVGAFAAVFLPLLVLSRLLDTTILDLARQNVGYVLTAFAALFVGFLVWLGRQVSKFA
jgi:hypothetical protein